MWEYYIRWNYNLLEGVFWKGITMLFTMIGGERETKECFPPQEPLLLGHSSHIYNHDISRKTSWLYSEIVLPLLEVVLSGDRDGDWSSMFSTNSACIKRLPHFWKAAMFCERGWGRHLSTLWSGLRSWGWIGLSVCCDALSSKVVLSWVSPPIYGRRLGLASLGGCDPLRSIGLVI